MSSVFQMNSITGAGTAAATTVASALSPKNQTQLPAKAMATSSTGATAKSSSNTSSSTDSSNSDITSDDFLTLLVSELKNQDPTQPTDPNAYITQLVGVNSLQQLISINQGITSLNTPAEPTSSSTSTDATSN
jgi:flagellar basal-body rod modification protein FlgD